MNDNKICFPFTWRTIRGIIGNIKYIPRMFKYYYQRARYGISELDGWNLDSYLTKILIRGCMELKHGVSHPYRFTPEEWADVLEDIIEDCEWYLTDHYTTADEYNRRYDIMFERLKENFGDLWD